MLGQPLPRGDREQIEQAIDDYDQTAGVRIIQEVLDRHCFIGININPESRVKSTQGPAPPYLVNTA